MDGIIQVMRGINRRALVVVLALAVLVMPLTFTRRADAHSSSWCAHSTKANDGTHYIDYTGGEWVGGTHYHFYDHYYLIGNFDHSATKQCAH